MASLLDALLGGVGSLLTGQKPASLMPSWASGGSAPTGAPTPPARPATGFGPVMTAPPQPTTMPLMPFLASTEGAGDYSTLFGHAQRPGAPFAGVDVSQMTIGQALEFADPSGPYAQYVAAQNGGTVATPMGAGQIVGSTLRQAAQEMGLPMDAPFNADTQQAIIDHLAQKRLAQGSTPQEDLAALRQEWRGLEKVPDAQLLAAIDAMQGGTASNASAATPPAAAPAPTDWLAYANQGATRNDPLAPALVDALSFLPQMGVRMEVFSGGQEAEGEGGHRTGSTRHDHGNAADVFFYDAASGRRLSWENEADIPVLQEIVRQGRANGITGWGAGEGYMQPGSMHLGFGPEAVWGAGGSGANAPGWLREAFGSPQGAPSPDTRIADAFAQPSGGAARSTSTGAPSMPPLTMPPQAQEPEFWDRFQGTPGLGWLADDNRRRDFAIALEGLRMNPNQARIESLRERTTQSRADQRTGRLVDFLTANGATDAAAMLAAGFSPEVAVAPWLQSRQPQAPAEPIVTDGGLVLNPDGSIRYDHRTGAAPAVPPRYMTGADVAGMFPGVEVADPAALYVMGPDGIPKPVEGTGGAAGEDAPGLSDATAFQSSYRGEGAVKRMQDVGNAYGNMQAAAQNNDHMALVYSYVKLLDPTSVVRETETGMVASSSSLPDALMGQINGWLSGEPLPQPVIERILRTGELYYGEAEAAFAPVYDQYAGTAEFYGLPPEQGPIDYRREWEPLPPPEGAEDAAAPAVVPAAPVPTPVVPPPAPTGAAPVVNPGEIPLMNAEGIIAILDAYEASGQPIPPRIANMLRQRAEQLEAEGVSGG